MLKDFSNQITTSRAILRHYRPDDYPAFRAITMQEEIWRSIGWPEPTEEKLQRWFSARLRPDPNGYQRYAIADPETDRLIGDLSIGPDDLLIGDPSTNDAPLQGKNLLSSAFLLSPEYQGRGIMKSLLQLIIDYLFSETDIDGMTYGYFENNLRSASLQRSIGFKPFASRIMKVNGETVNTKISILWNNRKERPHEFEMKAD